MPQIFNRILQPDTVLPSEISHSFLLQSILWLLKRNTVKPWTKIALYRTVYISRKKNKKFSDMPVELLVVAHNLALFSAQKSHTIFSLKNWMCFKMKLYTSGCAVNFIISFFKHNPFYDMPAMQNFRIILI